MESLSEVNKLSDEGFAESWDEPKGHDDSEKFTYFPDKDNTDNHHDSHLFHYTEEPRTLSWDNLQIPIPYRFQKNHVQLAKVFLTSTPPRSYRPLSPDYSKICVDTAWKLLDASIQPSSSPKVCLPPKPVYISHQQFIQSVLHLLGGRSSPVFRQNDDKFVKNPEILVSGLSPGALANYCGEFLCCGNIVRELTRLSDRHCYTDKNGKGPPPRMSIVDVAFIKFTGNYVKIFQTVLMLNFGRIKGFTKLISFLRPFHQQLELLHKIWFDTGFPHDSSPFLSSINNLLISESCPTSLAVIRSVFVACAGAYLRHVSDWMFRGQLPPSKSGSEFYIVMKAGENPYRDRRFWSKQFITSARECEIPAFLSESWKVVFETGKAVNFLKQIQSETRFPSSHSYSMNYDQEQQLHLIASFEELENLYVKWNEILTNKLTPLPQAEINDLCTVSSGNIEEQPKHPLDAESLANENDLEEKLDPSKLLTTSPPPYNTSHIKLYTTTIQLFEENKRRSSSPVPNLLQVHPNNQQEDNRNVRSLHLFLSQAVSLPAQIQCTIVNKALLHYYIEEKKLLHHISALNNFLCLQNGLFGHKLTELLIKEMDSFLLTSSKLVGQTDDISSRMGTLNAILAEAIVTGGGEDLSSNLTFSFNHNDELGDCHRSGGGDGKRLISSPYEGLNDLKLIYIVHWPLNVILTRELLGYFERVFLLQMRLLRVEFLLQGVFLRLKSTKGMKNTKGKSRQLFLLHSYRSRLHHFVRTIRNYINVTVVQVACAELTSSWEKMDSLDKIYDSLVRHIKSIHTNCLLGAKAEGVMKLLMNQLVIIETFCSQLQNSLSSSSITSGDIPDQEFKKLTQKYKAFEEIGKVFVGVAYKLVNRGYYPKVAYFLELYNFNGFFAKSNKGLERNESFSKT